MRREGDVSPERPPVIACPRCRAMVSAHSNKCPICGARLPSPERIDFPGLTLAFLVYPMLALAIACAALVLCVALIRWLGR
ncbi:hypothetical protein [Thermoflexus hugenholtzii]